jgi:hypothetical protein
MPFITSDLEILAGLNVTATETISFFQTYTQTSKWTYFCVMLRETAGGAANTTRVQPNA